MCGEFREDVKDNHLPGDEHEDDDEAAEVEKAGDA
jgi:hypothetical protein